ncbi:MAG: alpha/beta fold hydrolase, partial [Longimicrobiales bacterium]
MMFWKTTVWAAALLPASAISIAAQAVTGASNGGQVDGEASRADVRFGNVMLDTGVRLNYAETGSPGGDPVILLHGATDSWFSFSRLLPLLPAVVHAYALDQRGHGDSDRPQRDYAPRDLAQDVVAFMNAQGIARATV